MKVAYLPDPVKLRAKPGYPPPAVRARLEEGGIAFEQITVLELLAGCLTDPARDFTALCLPGGFAPNYDEKLGERGASLIRQFVEAGGSFIGLCAGAYYGSLWGAGLLPVEVVDIEHWARGQGPCILRVSEEGEGPLGTSGMLVVRYNNGPLLGILDSSRVTPLLIFESEVGDLPSDFPLAVPSPPRDKTSTRACMHSSDDSSLL